MGPAVQIEIDLSLPPPIVNLEGGNDYDLQTDWIGETVPGSRGWYAAMRESGGIIWHTGERVNIQVKGVVLEALESRCFQYVLTIWHGPFDAPQPGDFPGAGVCKGCSRRE